MRPTLHTARALRATVMATVMAPLMATVMATACVVANAQTVASPTRGQLLYAAHCIACHNTQMHWREQRQATDWASLREQVRRWQSSESLQWGDDDIGEVTRHLNDTIYRFPLPGHAAKPAARG